MCRGGITARENGQAENTINVPENTMSSLAVNHGEGLTMIQAGCMGTYVEAVFTGNNQPTVAQATEQPLF